FYLYLYISSIFFLIYVYVYLLHSPNASTTSFRTRKRRVAFDETNNHHTGSFYLRLGALAFGVGSMIHSGLNFGHYFEIHHQGDPCSELVQAVKPLIHLIFTFAQLYFVFQNSKVHLPYICMCIHRYRSLARFGLMHMSGTNICVWVRGIVVETLQVIRKSERQKTAKYLQENPLLDANNNSIANSNLAKDRYDLLPELACHWDAMMGRIVDRASDYLYPCTIEYSLICAAILYIMWRNVGYGKSPRREKSVSDDEYDGDSMRTTRMSVDCTGSSRGLFLGILMFVVGVVSLVAFYVLVNQDHLQTEATLLGHISESFMYLVSMVAVIFAASRMKDLHYSRKRGGLEQTLIIFALFGLFIFGMFSIVAAMFFIYTLDGVLTIITNFLMIIQAAMQAVFMMAALKMSASNVLHVRRKDGREYVTFLLMTNFALWAINTFETQRSEHNPLQLQFYGPKAWSIFSHISVPLGIFYRFHSTVCLSIIWKNAWKHK
ncbi:hypothetical protein LOTGIDRAFT_93565, partial [Lottia gigantea]